MAFHFWSIPLLIIFLLVAVAGIYLGSRGWKRTTKLLANGLAIIVAIAVGAFGVWATQGEESYWGEYFYLWSLAIAVVLCLVGIVAFARGTGRAKLKAIQGTEAGADRDLDVA